MIHTTTHLGGTASDVVVGKVAHGLMMMTWRDPQHSLPDEEAFEAIKAGVDALPSGTKMLINSGEFYGPNLSTANLELIARFFDKYPEYADKTFLSVKGGAVVGELNIDSSPENLRRSVDKINSVLRGTKKLDLFESARVDPKIPIEEAVKTLAELVKEGKFSHIGLSECKAETLRRAHAVHPISIVEIEVSLWSYEEETKKVIAAAKELGIAVAAYSPLGRGFLTGSIKKTDDLTDGDFRRQMTRFREEHIEQNLAFVEALKAIAAKKNITPAQIAIAWVSSLGEHVIPLPGSSNKKRTLENLAAADIVLTEADKAEIAKVMSEHHIKGDRYFGNDAAAMLWG
ncbi:aldo/keto reductase [Laetiporus sulphureus 93-53]|uniref:Aldo/keto reductase n=1 Tax=Laetiporus sulphureus 93-53 TaxID=1314785 RepID=A0A165EX58_9APHY|nr:aldo/keto reductase [Laetiporus sulphureus 93-53]KZT07914.1 aldo/keto reductase [Laetiporus sulphureus 93-53]